MAVDVKDKVVTVESAKAMHDYAMNAIDTEHNYTVDAINAEHTYITNAISDERNLTVNAINAEHTYTTESVESVRNYSESTYVKKSNITAGTEDLIEDESFLLSGDIYLVYE
jgi:hypothetical protein